MKQVIIAGFLINFFCLSSAHSMQNSNWISREGDMSTNIVRLTEDIGRNGESVLLESDQNGVIDSIKSFFIKVYNIINHLIEAKIGPLELQASEQRQRIEWLQERIHSLESENLERKKQLNQIGLATFIFGQHENLPRDKIIQKSDHFLLLDIFKRRSSVNDLFKIFSEVDSIYKEQGWETTESDLSILQKYLNDTAVKPQNEFPGRRWQQIQAYNARVAEVSKINFPSKSFDRLVDRYNEFSDFLRGE